MSPDTAKAASDRSALAAQERQTEKIGAHWWRGVGRADMDGWGGSLMDILVVAAVPRADEEVLEDEKMDLWYIVATANIQ